MAPPAHFNHAGASIPPDAVVDRIVTHLRLEHEIGGYEAAEAVADELEAVPGALGELIGAPGAGVVVVESATRAWETFVWALALSRRWTASDRVVVDQFAYSSSWGTLLRMRQALGVELAVAPARADGSVDPERLDQVVDDRTRLVLTTHVPTHLGTVSDVAAVGRHLAGRDLVYAVDASQSIGQLAFDVDAIGCQVAFAPARKFLRGPRGTGLLYMAPELADTLTPLSLDLTAASIGTDAFEPQPGAGRFVLYEHSPALRLGLGLAARHALEAGPSTVEGQVGRRTEQVVDLIRATPDARLVAQGPVSGIVSFVHDRLAPDDVRSSLRAEGVNIWTNGASGSPIDGDRRAVGPSVRVSPHYFTNDVELEALGRALHRLS